MNSGTSVEVSGAAGTASGDMAQVAVNVYAGGTATGSPVQTLNATANSGTGAYSVKSTGLPQGKYTLTASQSDAAGNVGTSSAVTYYTYNTLPGDGNGDSTVNFADFTVLSNNYGKSVGNGPTSGDFNYDGVVNFADFTILSNNYGKTFTAAPGAPTVKTTGSGSLVLNWSDNSNNETGFVVERSTDGVNFSPVVTLGAGATTYTDNTGLSPDTEYTYRVKAVNGSNSSSYSDVGSNRTLPAFVHTLWVDGSAAAGGNGSYANPYNTVAAGMTAAVAGDGIVVRGGTYKTRITFTKSGTSGSPITVMGTPGERVILSGFDAITGWTPLASNPDIYVATTTVNPSSLYTGMTQLEQARTPTGGWWVYQGTSNNAGAGTTTITDTAHLVGVGNLAGASVEMHVGASNVWATVKIISNDAAAGTISFATVVGLSPTDVYMVKNRAGFIGGAGQWASEDQGNGTYKVYYWARNPGELAQMQTSSASLSSMVNASNGVHDIVLSGFEIAGTKQYGVDLERVDHATVKNNIVHDNPSTGIWMRYDTNITISNNIVMLNGSGIGVGSVQHALITQNEVAHNVVDGMDLTGDVSGRQPGDAGFTPSDDVTASLNYIHDQNYGTTGHPDGIQMYRWITGVHITDNLIVNSGQGIMSEEVDDVAVPGTSTLSGNVIWGSAAYLIIFGHNNSNNWTVTNNTVGGEGYGPFSMTGFGYDMHDNIVVGGMSEKNYTGDNNLFWTTNPNGVIITDPSFKTYTTIPAWNAASGQDAHSVKADPMFNNMPLVWSVGASSGSGSTATSLVLRSALGFAVGQHIEIARDGVLRTITGISGNTITFDVPLAAPPLFDLEVDNWGSRTNYTWDSRLSPSSPGLTMSSTGGAVGSQINISQYKAGDFNGDGKRDLPTLPADVTAPNPAWWPA
jgi:parallel beta-helix repeat protein